MSQDPESQLDLLTGMRREVILLHSKARDYGKFTMTHLKNDDILINNPAWWEENRTFYLFTNFSWPENRRGDLVSYDIYDVYYDENDKLGWVKRNVKRGVEKPIKHSRNTSNFSDVSEGRIYFLERGFLDRTNFINWNELPWGGK
jgi:hypothetical protein